MKIKRLVMLIALIMFMFISYTYSFFTQELSVVNSTATLLTNFQVKVIIDSTKTGFWGYVKTDGGDIRFKTMADVDLPYYVESFNYGASSAVIWVKVPSIPASGNVKINLVYGEISANTLSNGNATFDFFDDFTGSSISTNWTVTNATGWTVGNGELKATSTTGRLKSVSTFNAPIVLEAKFRTVTRPTNGYSALSLFASGSNVIGMLIHPGNDYYRNDGSWVGVAGASSTVTNVAYRTKFNIKSGNTNDFYCYNNSTGATLISVTGITKTVTNLPIMIGERQDDSYTGQAYEAYWDWITARKYNSVDPTITFGTLSRSGSRINVYVAKDNFSVEGVVVSLLDKVSNSTTTSTTAIYNGFLAFNSENATTYLLTLSKSGYMFSPNNVVFATTGTTDVTLKISAFTVPSASDVQIVSNPFTPGSSDSRLSKVSFLVGNTNSEEIKLNIFNLKGGLIKEISAFTNEISWDGKDGSGALVSGGVYIYQILLAGSTVKKGAVVLIK